MPFPVVGVIQKPTAFAGGKAIWPMVHSARSLLQADQT